MGPRSIDAEDRIRRIRELCVRAAKTENPDEAQEIASQLRAELHDQIVYVRTVVAMHRSRVFSEAEDDESE
jgi:hypothetical protein